MILLGSLRFNIDLMAKQIHHIERIKFTISFYISRTDKIGLVNVVKIKWFSEIRIFNTFGNVRSFF